MSERLANNAFHLLEIPPTASAAEVERQGQKWLMMLAAGLAGADVVNTALGPRTRTAEDVRWALDQLRDPDRRAQHALWAALDPSPTCPTPDGDVRWPQALSTAVWSR